MRKLLSLLIACLATGLGGTTARADFVVYTLPSGMQIMLQGRTSSNGRDSMSFYPTMAGQGPLYFTRDSSLRVIKTPTNETLYGKMKIKAGKNADDVFRAAIWALKKGLTREFWGGVEQTLKLDPEHPGAKRVAGLKDLLAKPLPDTEDARLEKEMRAIVKQSSLRVMTSPHFMLLTDTPERAPEGKRQNRAKDRLDLLEKVYVTFYLLFAAHDVELEIPQERLKVVLFNDHADFLEHGRAADMGDLSSVAGFYMPGKHISFFYANAGTPLFKALDKVKKQLTSIQKVAKTARDKDTVRLISAINYMLAVEEENLDIEVVSHEGTHHMAAATGLLPRHVRIPRWIHEGLATYFESPRAAAWGGVGTVAEFSLGLYRDLEDDREHSNIEFIVTDQVFDYAGNLGSILHAYAQAWALTHYLMETRPQDFVAFYRSIGEMPPDAKLRPEVLSELFSQIFGKDRKALDQDWRSYMRTLKTDLEILEEAENDR